MISFARSCMNESVEHTLTKIEKLRAPVIRSCHIGNNTVNNWGWLNLARNTRMVQYDHTLYGVDEVAVPWVALSDHGKVARCLTHKGEEVRDFTGSHVNKMIPAMDRRYSAYLNFGICGNGDGESDLITSHCKTSARLCESSTLR